jgi:hypothetical protein
MKDRKWWIKLGTSFTSGGYISSTAQIADDVIVASDIDDETITTAKLKGEGTATQVLTSNGTGSSPSFQDLPPAAVQNFKLISQEALGSDLEGYTFSGITGYSKVIMYFNILAASGDSSDIGIQFNSDTGAKYNWFGYDISGTTLSVRSGGGGNSINTEITASDSTIVYGKLEINATSTLPTGGMRTFTFEAYRYNTSDGTKSEISTISGDFESSSDITSVYIYMRDAGGDKFDSTSYFEAYGVV